MGISKKCEIRRRGGGGGSVMNAWSEGRIKLEKCGWSDKLEEGGKIRKEGEGYHESQDSARTRDGNNGYRDTKYEKSRA